MRLDMPRGISNHQQQAVTSKERMAWERELTEKPHQRSTGYEWEHTEQLQSSVDTSEHDE